MANDELYTPKIIFDRLGLEFDLDVASSYSDHIKTPTKNRFTIEDDAFSKDWFGKVWMNPPFSKPRPWVEKWLKHGNGVALLPLSGNSGWWRKLWLSEAAVVMIEPNTGFTNTDGEEKKIMYGISLWAIGDENIQALRAFGKVR
jgi:hypothetical protein